MALSAAVARRPRRSRRQPRDTGTSGREVKTSPDVRGLQVRKVGQQLFLLDALGKQQLTVRIDADVVVWLK